MLIDLMLFFTGLLSALIIPLIVLRRIKNNIRFHPRLQTLSYLGNKWFYDKNITKGYKIVLFIMAFLTLIFFWLLTEKFQLRGHQKIFKWLSYSVSFLVLLAFFPHNIARFRWHNFNQNIVRILHNVSAIFVFISISMLIITFQIEILTENKLAGIIGLLIIGLTLILMLLFMIRSRFNSITEEIFIFGTCCWEIFILIMVFII